MNKFFSFAAGALCGLLIGGVTALLLAPDSGENLRGGAKQRLDDALSEARKAMDDTRRDLEAQFENMKQYG